MLKHSFGEMRSAILMGGIELALKGNDAVRGPILSVDSDNRLVLRYDNFWMRLAMAFVIAAQWRPHQPDNRRPLCFLRSVTGDVLKVDPPCLMKWSWADCCHFTQEPWPGTVKYVDLFEIQALRKPPESNIDQEHAANAGARMVQAIEEAGADPDRLRRFDRP